MRRRTKLSETGTYFVTAGTYLKTHYFRTRDRLDVLHTGLLKVAQDFSWQLGAWTVFSNHYHFVGRSPEDADEKHEPLENAHCAFISTLPSGSIGSTKTAGRKIWHNFWDTKLTIRNHTSRG